MIFFILCSLFCTHTRNFKCLRPSVYSDLVPSLTPRWGITCKSYWIRYSCSYTIPINVYFFSKYRTGIRSLVLLMPMLGVAWIIGLAVNVHISIAYIFDILSASQVCKTSYSKSRQCQIYEVLSLCISLAKTYRWCLANWLRMNSFIFN